MLTAAERLERAVELERLADSDPEPFRQTAYRQMAAFWRASAKVRPYDGPDDE